MNEKIVAEVRFYRSIRPDRSFVPNAVHLIADQLPAYGAARGLLITTAHVSESEKQVAQNRNVDVWDFKVLEELLKVHAHLADPLKSLIEDGDPGAFGTEAFYEMLRLTSRVASELELKASSLIRTIEDIPSGERADDFEKACADALKYLFENDMAFLRPQHRIEGGFHRLDHIARLDPKQSFWKDVCQDFGTRFIVFEFKNYTGTIGQDQIYSTEKYLYKNALRTVALIVARNGIDDGAARAIKAALRESGKLIIHINLDDLKTMLTAKDAAKDYLATIVDRVTGILTDLTA